MKSTVRACASPNTLDEPRFPPGQCDALFAAVLDHDAIDLDATLPGAIHLDYSPEQFIQCYRICRQIWKEGVNRDALVAIVENSYRHRSLGPEDQLSFKTMRARIKHLRFAYAVFDERHRYPWLFHHMTRAMGYLQDALRNEQHAAVGRLAIRTRLFLTRFAYALATRKIDRFRPSSTEAFRKHINDEIGFIRIHLAKQEITSKEFHEMRKVISRQVALYDNLKTLYPSPYHRSVSQYLGTINGLMGNMHDELITEKLKNTQDYYSDTFKIPEDIRQRLIAVTERYVEPLGHP